MAGAAIGRAGNAVGRGVTVAASALCVAAVCGEPAGTVAGCGAGEEAAAAGGIVIGVCSLWITAARSLVSRGATTAGGTTGAAGGTRGAGWTLGALTGARSIAGGGAT